MRRFRLKDSAIGYAVFTKDRVYDEDFVPKGYSWSVKHFVKVNPHDWEEVKEETLKEPLDLTKILKGCEGQTFYCTILGEVTLITTTERDVKYPIRVTSNKTSTDALLSKEGLYLLDECTSECILFPSKENRDWSTFKPKIPFGTPVMVSNSGTHWKLKKYNEILQNTNMSIIRNGFHNFSSEVYPLAP